jgi:hypothetical protein
MAEQQLNRTQIASVAVDQVALGPPQLPSTELAQVETNVSDPITDKPDVWPRRKCAALQGRLSAREP